MKWLALIVLAAGCAKTGVVQRGDAGPNGDVDLAGGGQDAGGGPPDFATPIDLAGRDFAGVDFANTVPVDMAGMCALFPQSGCGANEKCEYTGTGNSCASAGNKQNGQICGAGGTDDCVAGAECVGAGAGSTVTTCRMFCAADSDCMQAPVASGATAEPNNKGHCLLQLTGTTTSLCTFACNPVSAAGASGCAAGLGCQTWASMTVPEFSDCGPVGTIGDGGNCPNGNTDCLSGFVCVQSGTAPNITKHCRQACRQGHPGDCAGAGYLCATAAGATMFGFCCPGSGC